MEAAAAYEQGKQGRAAQVAALEGRSRALGLLRLVVFAGILGLLGAIVWVPLSGRAWLGELGLVLLFAGLVLLHARVEDRKQRARAGMRFHERGLARLSGRWSESPTTGERFRTAAGPEHPFTDDLDIFGQASLFQMLDTTETRFGEERLARLLSSAGEGTEDVAAWAAGVRATQEAVRDLAPRVVFRESLSALGALLGSEKPDPRPFLEWAEGGLPLKVPAVLTIVARVMPVLAVGLLVATAFTPGARAPLLGLVALCVGIVAVTRGRAGRIAGLVSAREAGLGRYAEMLHAIEAERFTSPRLVALQQQLAASGRSATLEMRALSRIVGFVDARNNEIFRFFIGPVLLWDLNCALSLDRWRHRTGKGVRAWFEVLGEIEALSSLAAFSFEHPTNAWPELSTAPVFRAEGIGHPMIPEARRVVNDVALEGRGHGLIVTGSNMSGKSTLLRAMGINAVLALAGAPVCARGLVVGPVRVATSMRIRDSLEQGVSHFYAELQKLKRVLDMARRGAGQGGTVLFLLDEILHGTNSRERILGARAIIRELLSRGAMGAVSTHDLGISDLEQEIAREGLTVRNVHFQEQVEGDTMTFDYRLRDGIVQSSNALRLMKLVGIDVALP